jgi:hypothetical protein
LNCNADISRVGDVAQRHLQVLGRFAGKVVQKAPATRAIVMNEGANGVVGFQQRLNEVASNKPTGAGNEYFHSKVRNGRARHLSAVNQSRGISFKSPCNLQLSTIVDRQIRELHYLAAY